MPNVIYPNIPDVFDRLSKMNCATTMKCVSEIQRK